MNGTVEGCLQFQGSAREQSKTQVPTTTRHNGSPIAACCSLTNTRNSMNPRFPQKIKEQISGKVQKR